MADVDRDGIDDSIKSDRQIQIEQANKIPAEIQKLSPSAIIELFVLDLSDFATSNNLNNEDPNFYFHAGVGELKLPTQNDGTVTDDSSNRVYAPVVWQGKTYQALPIEVEGFEVTTQGTLPRPVLRVANIKGLISSAIAEYDDLVGCKITRKRTFKKFLDAENFEHGNPDADPHQHFPDEIWYVEQKKTETRYTVEWELSSPLDLQGVQLPRRQLIQNSCCWRYCDAGCGYKRPQQGPWYDVNDKQVGSITQDVCGKRLESCKLRFKGVLPFGGFPGANRYST